MKKIYLLLSIAPLFVNAQVGIGIANPTADLHVGGNNSTIRIESLSAVNEPVYNDGVKPSLAYVTPAGDVTLAPSGANGTGPGGTLSPINFLLSNQNFIPDGATGRGVVINSPTGQTNTTGLIGIIPFSSPASALIEVKYSITGILSSTDLNVSLTPFNDISARTIKYYFCIDKNNDGLDAVESSRKYGLNAQSYTSYTLGILGYSYTNGHGYTTIPAGNHTLHFFAEIIDGTDKFTSAGFGGDNDLLRIRIYN